MRPGGVRPLAYRAKPSDQRPSRRAPGPQPGESQRARGCRPIPSDAGLHPHAQRSSLHRATESARVPIPTQARASATGGCGTGQHIAVEDFAAYAQWLVVRYLRSVSDEAANWYEEWWTGARGRYCLCHAMHGGTNNNMGIEVDWRDIKKLCPPSATLPTFLGSLVHFIKEIGKEHEDHLASCGHPNAFICEPILHKRMHCRICIRRRWHALSF